MDLHVTFSGRVGLADQLYRQLREGILDGRLRAGEGLPATRALAERLEVSRNTVTHAYQRLIAEGFLSGRVGAGTFVSPDGAAAAASPRRAPPGKVLRPRAIWRALAREPGELGELAAADRAAGATASGLAAAAAATPAYDFRVGTPDLTLFPWDVWRRLVARQLRPRRARGNYGDPAGLPRLREAIARHAGVSRGVRAGAADVLVTSGAQQALDLIARVLVEPGACVAIEEPGYLPARRLFASHGATIAPVRVDAEGLDVAALPAAARLVYVTPSHQFPLGVPMSLARRLALLAWARRHGAAIIEDDYDSELRFAGRPLEPLQSLDRHGRVIYVGSFSKVLVPSLRLGFLVAPASLGPALAAARSLTDWHGAHANQGALAELIDDGLLARQIRGLIRVYAERRARLTESLERHLGGALEPQPSSAGLHLAAFLRDRRRDADLVARRALAGGVAVQSLAPYYQGRPRAGLALGYGMIATSRIEEGVRRLARAIDP